LGWALRVPVRLADVFLVRFLAGGISLTPTSSWTTRPIKTQAAALVAALSETARKVFGGARLARCDSPVLAAGEYASVPWGYGRSSGINGRRSNQPSSGSFFDAVIIAIWGAVVVGVNELLHLIDFSRDSIDGRIVTAVDVAALDGKHAHPTASASGFVGSCWASCSRAGGCLWPARSERCTARCGVSGRSLTDGIRRIDRPASSEARVSDRELRRCRGSPPKSKL
jgi:hypothetical protein